MKSEQNIARKMKLIGLMSHMGLIGLMGLGLMGCSSDEVAAPMAEESTMVQVLGYVAGYEEPSGANESNRANEANRTNRAWSVPSGYSLYEEDNSISVFFTQDGKPTGVGASPEEEFFFNNNGSWRVSKKDLAAETYYLYGYMPFDKSINATISSSATAYDNSSYSTGAVLTIGNLPTISPNDFCVIVGAKNGLDADNDNGLTTGQFAYAAQPTETAGKSNYVYLLFDHLYAALRVRMKVYGGYDALRTIKLKELKLKTSVGETATKKKTTATITLAKTLDGSSPISSIVFTPEGDAEAEGSMYKNDEGMTLTAENSTFISHFMPVDVTTFILESTYDVYDKQGNLVRQDCKAENTIRLSKLVTGQTVTRRGARYTINMTIRPTYLYVLSEPDLDNPTVVVEQ